MKKVPFFGRPIFPAIISGVAIITGAIVLIRNKDIPAYLLGVIASLPAYIITKNRIKDNIEYYAVFVTKSHQERYSSGRNIEIMSLLLMTQFVLIILALFIFGSALITALGTMFWAFIWIPEYKEIYSKANQLISNKTSSEVKGII